MNTFYNRSCLFALIKFVSASSEISRRYDHIVNFPNQVQKRSYIFLSFYINCQLHISKIYFFKDTGK